MMPPQGLSTEFENLADFFFQTLWMVRFLSPETQCSMEAFLRIAGIWATLSPSGARSDTPWVDYWQNVEKPPTVGQINDSSGND